ncbi:uncharacterized protein LOC115880366 [Sitophilus oryzae]|uniref:Uncharacterized protein LOC115880366 n=1 Tax=Sitophilus oryzae TaxID=7048 RepID=A0A6J2XQU0_SITOR|nr:uncharacterized protein LOC115880366 [Sitophilus oryzae]XP_030753437.1 uncharacterized protein LOC115880366 [Sitophilus oryzae]
MSSKIPEKAVQGGSCTFCDKYDSTLEEHIETMTHKRAAKRLFCHFCGIQFFSDSERNKHRNESEDHETKTITRVANHPLFKILPEDSDEQLDEALQKLVYYLYYSNALPYNVTLEYLRYYQQKVRSKHSIFDTPTNSSEIFKNGLANIIAEQHILLKCDKKANSTRIKVLQEIQCLVKLFMELRVDLHRTRLPLVSKWNEVLFSVTKNKTENW